MFDANFFAKACRLVWGNVGWLDAAGAELDVSRRTLERWLDGSRAPQDPANVYERIARAAEKRAPQLTAIAGDLRRRAKS